METAGVEPAFPRCKRGALPLSYIPVEVRTGGVEPPQREAAGLQPVELAECSASARQGRPAGFEPTLRDSHSRVLPLHHGHHVDGDDGTRTRDISPDKRVLLPLSYAPLRRRLRCRNRRGHADMRGVAVEGEVEGGIGSPQPEAETLPSEHLRSQLLPIGAPANACPRRHLLTGWPWRLSEASCTLGPALCTSPCSVTS